MGLGEGALAAGAADAALDAFERAAQLQHAADAEVGIVRSHMQAGDYRRALAFGAHAAGAHRDHPEAMALYAWLLYRGGETVAADRYLRQGLQGAPDDADLLWVRGQLPVPEPGHAALAAGPAGVPPSILAPSVTGAAVPPGARVVGTAALAPDGLQAWVPLATLPPAGRLWLRNGLGQTAAADVLRRDVAHGIALLALRVPLHPPTVALAPDWPFAGSPAATVEYETGPGARPAWPMLRQGFFGQPGSPLSIQASSDPHGGPVFDRTGRLAGLALPGVPSGLVPMADLAALARITRPESFVLAEVAAPPGPPAVDAVYEAALRVALQVLAAD